MLGIGRIGHKPMTFFDVYINFKAKLSMIGRL
jgi:hypothetical protein